jgi:hypothetical protein
MSTVALIIGVVFLFLWLLGFVSSYTLGGFISIALIAGIVLVAVSLMHRLLIRRQ